MKLPKVCKPSSKDKLYLIEVVEIDGSRARVHYIGYNSSSNEWRDLAELVTIPPTPRSHYDNTSNVTGHNMPLNIPIQPFSLYNELRIKIKQALVCRSGKTSPSVIIDMGFDYLLLKGGLQAVGVAEQKTHGNNVRYKLKCYKDRGLTKMVIMPLSSLAV